MCQNRGPDGREAEPIMGNNGSKMAILRAAYYGVWEQELESRLVSGQKVII